MSLPIMAGVFSVAGTIFGLVAIELFARLLIRGNKFAWRVMNWTKRPKHHFEDGVVTLSPGG